MTTTISIVSPVYNAEAYLAQTIESVIYQTGTFFIEYIIIDGGSTDSTLDICAQYQKRIRNDQRFSNVTISLLSERDDGMYDALSKGLKLVSGEIVAYLNASDFYLPNALSTVNEVFCHHPDIFWLTGFNTFSNSRGHIFDSYLPYEYKRKWIPKYVYGGQLKHIQQESTFWRSELTDLIDFPTLASQRYAGDFYLWCCFSRRYDLEIVHALLGCFRVHSKQLSTDLEAYAREASTITSSKQVGILNLFFQCHRFLWYAPNKIKRLINRNIINIFKYK